MADVDDMKNNDLFLEYLGKLWALSISQIFERVYNKISTNSLALADFLPRFIWPGHDFTPIGGPAIGEITSMLRWSITLVKGSPEASQLRVAIFISSIAIVPRLLTKYPVVGRAWVHLVYIETDTNLSIDFNFTGASEYCDELMNIFYIL